MKRVASESPQPVPAALAEPDESALVQHPDGWYWLADDGRQEIGPFDSAALALADLRAAQDGSEPGASLREAEDEIGVADWIDPETHAPAEDGTPHIDDQ